MTDSILTANLFSALAHPTRVDILKCLLPHAMTGMNFGQLATAISTPNSTLKHHLTEMESGGVVTTRRQGRATVICLNLTHLSTVLTTLNDLCCSAQSKETPENET